MLTESKIIPETWWSQNYHIMFNWRHDFISWIKQNRKKVNSDEYWLSIWKMHSSKVRDEDKTHTVR